LFSGENLVEAPREDLIQLEPVDPVTNVTKTRSCAMIVINKHKATPEEFRAAVYIGRGSPLGNPYVLGQDGTRAEVVEKYRKWLVKKLIHRDPIVEVAFRKLRPEDTLMCYCAPEPCHGDVIKVFYEELCGSGVEYDLAMRMFKERYSLDRIDYPPSEDGVTHINVWSRAKTPMGRALSNFAHTPFDHPAYGYFSSVEGFWYWLSTGKTNNLFRSLYGFKAKEAGRLVRKELDANGGVPIVENFDAEIKKALLCKIEQNEELRRALKESDLPLTHYYVWGEEPNIKITTPEDFAWIHQYIEELRLWLNGKAHKVVIAGSRSITDFKTVERAYCDSGYKAIELVSGMAPGVDQLAVQLARKLKLPLVPFPADWDGLGKVAGFSRNTQMAQYADAGVLVWDGESSGTKHMQIQLLKHDKPYVLYRLTGRELEVVNGDE